MARPKGKGDPALDFEKAIARLEEIVRKLEEEEISLEASLALYEEGLKLQRACESRLQEADNRIKKLVENAGGMIEEEDFEPVEPAEAALTTEESSQLNRESAGEAGGNKLRDKGKDDLPF